MVNNTVVNQSSFDDICNIHENHHHSNVVLDINPLTQRSNAQQNRFSDEAMCKECYLEKEKSTVT
jgi:hypothetical protein